MAEQERPPDPAAKRADGFERLRQRFVAGLPRRWREIDEASDDAARQAALHRLAGAAGSFGLEPLGQAARRAEQALRRGDAAAARHALDALARQVAAAGVTVF